MTSTDLRWLAVVGVALWAEVAAAANRAAPRTTESLQHEVIGFAERTMAVAVREIFTRTETGAKQTCRHMRLVIGPGATPLTLEREGCAGPGVPAPHRGADVPRFSTLAAEQRLLREENITAGVTEPATASKSGGRFHLPSRAVAELTIIVRAGPWRDDPRPRWIEEWRVAQVTRPAATLWREYLAVGTQRSATLRAVTWAKGRAVAALVVAAEGTTQVRVASFEPPGASTPKPASQPASGPRVVSPVVLEAQRISGTIPALPPNVKEEVFQSVLGSRPGTAVTIFKTCLDAEGAIGSNTVLKFSGSPLLDDYLAMHLMRWRYRPYHLNGKPLPICGSKVFNVNLR